VPYPSQWARRRKGEAVTLAQAGTGGEPERVAAPAALLESRRPEILRDLERRLHGSGSRLARDPAVLPECIARADAILASAVDELHGQGPAAAVEVAPAGEQAPGGTGLLMDVVTRELLRAAAGRPEALPDVSVALNTVHRSLLAEATAEGDSYDLFILRTADEARRRERRQLAREIHDELGHQLSIVLHQLELSALHRESAPEKAADRVDRAREHVAEAIGVARRLITDFAEPRLPVDLHEEIVTFAGAASAGRVDLDVRVSGPQQDVPDRHRHELLLIIREALVNVFTHAGASTVSVFVDIMPGCVLAAVKDDGVGFLPGAPPGPGRRGFGTVSMRERAAGLGGTLAITSRPGGGTLVEARLPLGKELDAR
jgi:signal transduction histidine kinase